MVLASTSQSSLVMTQGGGLMKLSLYTDLATGFHIYFFFPIISLDDHNYC